MRRKPNRSPRTTIPTTRSNLWLSVRVIADHHDHAVDPSRGVYYSRRQRANTAMQYEQALGELLDNGRADIARIVLSTPAMIFFLLSPRAGFEDEPLAKLYGAGVVAYAVLLGLLFLLVGVLF